MFLGGQREGVSIPGEEVGFGLRAVAVNIDVVLPHQSAAIAASQP